MIHHREHHRERSVKALDDSITKWKRNVRVVPDRMTIGTATCPLCQQFFDNSTCKGCPVSAHTGQFGCCGTPYDDIRKHWETRDQPESAMALRKAARGFLCLLVKLKKGLS